MVERDTRDYKELGDFVLVNNEHNQIFGAKDVQVRPIAIGRNGVQYEIADKQGSIIGIVDDNKKFKFDEKYKSILKEKMGKFYYELGMDDVFQYDVMEELRKQEEKEKAKKEFQDEHEENVNNNNQSNKEHSKENNDDNNNKFRTEDDTITKEDIENQGYGSIEAYSIVKEEKLLKRIGLPENASKYSALVIKSNDQSNIQYKFLYKDKVTGELKELEPRTYENYNTDEASRIQNGKEYSESMGARMDFRSGKGNIELNVYQETSGQLFVGTVSRTEEGKPVITPVQTERIYPEDAEKNRTNDAMDANYASEPASDIILSKEEMEKYIDECVRNQKTRDAIKERTIYSENNYTKEELNEIIEEEQNIAYENDRRGRGLRPRI